MCLGVVSLPHSLALLPPADNQQSAHMFASSAQTANPLWIIVVLTVSVILTVKKVFNGKVSQPSESTLVILVII